MIVVGSLNADLVVPIERFPQPGETILGGEYARHPGGKGANQAVAAARAGGRVRMIGRVGDDAFGAWLREGLAADGIDTSGVASLDDAPTGAAFISVGPGAQNVIIVSPGANARLRPSDLDPADLAGAGVVLLQLEVPLDTTLAAAALGRRAGARVVLNLAPATHLSADDLLDVDVLVVNEHEAALLEGGDPDAVAAAPEATARALTALTPAVVITLGAAGAVWAERDRRAGHVPGFPVRAVDTTAAGDAFVGALGAALDAGTDLREALRRANAAGALAVQAHGAQPSLPTAAAIDAFLREVAG